MAVHCLTSDPKPSHTHQGWWFAYYNKPTPRGGECTALLAPAAAEVIRRGFTFDDSCIRFDDALRASVLDVDFTGAPVLEEPSLPPDPETGWADPDYPAPTPTPQQAAQAVATAPAPSTNGHRPGVRPAAVRRREAEQLAVMGKRLPPGLAKTGMEVAQLLLMQRALLSDIPEPLRTQMAQKCCAIASIPYYRQQGIQLTEEDVQGMTAY